MIPGYSGKQQQLTGLLETHQQQQKQLMAERHKLLVQNGSLLHEYVRAGLKLPGPSSDDGASKRDLLVAQLVQEEGAARAALEALKGGTTLAKAREIGESVMRQAQELAAPVPASDPAAAIGTSTVFTAATEQGAQDRAYKGKSVFLVTPKEEAASYRKHHQSSSTEMGASCHAHADVEYGSSCQAGSRISSSRPAAGYLDSCNGEEGRTRWQRDEQAAASWEQPARGQRPHHPNEQDAPPAYIQELKAQVTALQLALESQIRTAANPWNQLLPAAMTAAAVMANPTAAAAAGQAGSVLSPGLGVMPGLGGLGLTSGSPGIPPDLLAADPSLAAAAAAHARDMAMLRMDVEKARGVAELQQLKSQLMQLQQATGSNGHQQYPAAPELLTDRQQDSALNVALHDHQQLEAKQVDEQQIDNGETGSLQHKLFDPDDCLSGFPATTASDAEGPLDSLQPAVGCNQADGAGGDDELLGIEQGSAVLAAKGSNADTDVLQVHITTAGPFTKRGTYRASIVLYEGYQPVESAPGVQISASTSKRAVVPLGSAAAVAAAQQGDEPSDGSSLAASSPGMANFNETLSLKGMKLASSTQLVFELYMAKPGLAGLPTKELLVGWTVVPLLQNGQVPLGLQSMPLFRLPLMLTAQRKFTYDHALLDFKVTHYRGAPGDVDVGAGGVVQHGGTGSAGGPAGTALLEDIPGVPSAAWVRVQRGVPPADPYTPGDGFVVMIDAARFLPCSTTISKVIGSVWSSSGSLLAGPFDGVAQPDSDAFSPAYTCSATLGSNLNGTRFENPTATLMTQVHTIERTSRSVRVVGFALLNLFLDPKTGGPPVSRSIQDYVLNQGAFQVPLHAGSPSTSTPLRVTSLDDVPRLPCASLLIRLLTPEAAKIQRRKPTPQYSERVYDSVSRCLPTALERKLYAKVLQRKPFTVREAARLVAWFGRQPGGLGGSRRSTTSDAPVVHAAAAAAAASGGNAVPSGGSSRLLARVFGSGSEDEAAAAAAAILNTGDPAAAVEELQHEVEVSKTEPLPPTDPEIMDWMSDTISNATAAAAAAAAKSGSTGSDSSSSSKAADLTFINYNTGYEYNSDLGFFVALDGACRLSRLLPAAGLISYSPPGSLYQDQPVVDEVKVTLDYDLDAPLAAPRWLDGYQQFADVPYQAGLVLLFDVRCIVPGSGSSAPVGWACLPVFERAGRFVATGTYHLPLFQGVPSSQLLTDLSSRGDPDAAMSSAIKSGRVRPAVECSSVVVRLMCGSRQGQLEVPAWSCNMQELRLPRYVVTGLGAKCVAEMRKMIRNKTYSQAKPKTLTDDQWVDQINDTLIKVAGLDENLAAADDEADREGSSRLLDDEAAAAALQ